MREIKAREEWKQKSNERRLKQKRNEGWKQKISERD
jgi:hypothetical protein